MAADLAKKLGIKPGQVVCLVDAPTEAAVAIRSQSPAGVTFVAGLGQRRCDVLLFWPAALAGLAERFRELQFHIDPDGAIWAVIPKKKYAGPRGVPFTWEQMQAAGLQTDLVDNKVASVTEAEYGTRFVIRKDRREKYR
jgi:hypothetical protein